MLNLVARMLGAADALSCPWGNLRFQHVAAIRAELEKQYKPATVNKALAAVRGAMRAAWLLGQMTAEDYHKAREVKGVRNHTLPAGRELSFGEIAALIATCENDPTPAGARDAAIIAVAYIAGLRREELAGLDLADYDPETGKLIIRGKGSKERTGYVANGAGRALADWLTLRGKQEGALFQPVNKGGHIQPQRMTPQAVYNMLAKRGQQAGIENFSPHDLRRTFVSDLLEAGADISTVAKMAGHASVITTQRYDRRPEDATCPTAGGW
jgi:site-specific recombinase XerD